MLAESVALAGSVAFAPVTISHSVQLALLVAPYPTLDVPDAHGVQLAMLVAPGVAPYVAGGQALQLTDRALADDDATALDAFDAYSPAAQSGQLDAPGGDHQPLGHAGHADVALVENVPPGHSAQSPANAAPLG